MNKATPAAKHEQKRRGGIDPAALAAATLASAISSIAPPGPYTPVSTVIGITVLFVILAYDIDPFRTFFQSVAYACAIALLSTLAIGFPLEYMDAEYSAKSADSKVSQMYLVGVWFAIAALFLTYDRCFKINSKEAPAILGSHDLPPPKSTHSERPEK